MTEPRSEIFTIDEIRLYQTMVVRFFLKEILESKQYFSPRTIRKRFLRQLHLRKRYIEELRNRVSQYTRPILFRLQSTHAVAPYNSTTYIILDREKIKEFVK